MGCDRVMRWSTAAAYELDVAPSGLDAGRASASSSRTRSSRASAERSSLSSLALPQIRLALAIVRHYAEELADSEEGA
jgi:hypothetical protein